MRFIAAKKIFNGKEFLPLNSVLILDDFNCFCEVTSIHSVAHENIEKYDGIICPGFVNVHCHLELSFLRNKIKQHTGFTGFAEELIAIRPTFTSEQICEAMKEAEKEMWNNGIVAVGDISNTSESFELKDKSKIIFHTFIELIGLNPERKTKVLEDGKKMQKKIKNHSSTLSPHAPYTVSSELVNAIGNDCDPNLPLTIHNQESKAENEFFETGIGKVRELYHNLNIDISFYKPSQKSSIKTYLPWLPANKNLILVHNTFTNEDDISFAELYSKKIFWCFCPNANLFIENTLPDVDLFLTQSEKIVIGTDSLASNNNLNVLHELNSLFQKSRKADEEMLLKWATYNGACALNMQNQVGSYIKGKNAGLNLITLNNRQFSFVKKLA